MGIVSFSHLGNHGRFGNSLFQIAATVAYSIKNNIDYIFPKWKYASYFNVQINQSQSIPRLPVYREKSFLYDEIPAAENIDLYGYFQSEKYFKHCESEIRALFEPSEKIKNIIQQKYGDVLKQETCAIHIRRGDYLRLSQYHNNLSLHYYKMAVDKVKADWYFVFSDDIEWCKDKIHGERVIYVRTGDDIIDFFIMAQCKNFIIANSSYSWWASYLSDNVNKRVIAPLKSQWFTESNKKNVDDLYLPNWEYPIKSAVIIYHKNISRYPKEWIDRCIYSIDHQTYQNFDVFEIDYGGDEIQIHPASIFKSLKLNDHAVAHNHLLDIVFSKGYDCAFNVNVDDFYSLDRFEKQIEYILKGYDVVSSNFLNVNEDGSIIATKRVDSLNFVSESDKNHNIIAHPVCCYSKNFWTTCTKLWSEQIPRDDFMLWKRSYRNDQYQFIILPDFLLYYRISDLKSSSKNTIKENSSYASITIHTVLYNEEVMFPYFISFYRSRFPDCKIVVHDNGSTDNTLNIAREHNCEIVEFDTGGEIDDERLKELKNNCWKGDKTKWVIVCDCDELLDITKEQLDYESIYYGTTIISSEAYNMVNLNEDMDVSGITHGCREVTYDKKILFNKCAVSEINYCEGAHSCNPVGKIKYSEKKYTLYHYKFINFDYMVNRYASYKVRLSEKNIENHWSSQFADSARQVRLDFDKAKSNSQKLLNATPNMDIFNNDINKFSNLMKSYSCSDIYFFTGVGNIGDYLIYDGTRTLLKNLGIKYKEVPIIGGADKYKGELALICGGGAWCRSFNEYMPKHLSIIESNFKNVIVLPSSFEVNIPVVGNAISKSKALFIARENESYRQIKDICNAELMHDHAFHFDYSKYRKKGNGILNVFRTDSESASSFNPANNLDISASPISLSRWLDIISEHEIINTDRAHVMVAAAMMGKTVYYKAGNYHKVPEMVKYSLSGFSIFPLV